MDYTKVPRILIYKERSSLEDFGVYEANTFNAILYEALMSLDDLKPRRKGAFKEILQLFNDAYYLLTIIFLEQNPIERYAEYCEKAGSFPEGNQFVWDSKSRELVVKCMLFVMLRTFGKNLTSPLQRLLETISNDIDDCAGNDMGTALRQLRGEEEDVVYKITCKFLYNHMPNSISKQYYTRRDIQELLNDEVSLKDCLYAGKTLGESVNILCKNNKQKLVLIERLLEPEKDSYGVFNSIICSAYQSLYELKSELTGEPLPEEFPFEQAGRCIIPMVPTPHIFNYQKQDDTENSPKACISELEEQDRKSKEHSPAISADNEVAEKINSLEEQLANEKEKNKKLEKDVEFHKNERKEMLKELLLHIIHKESDVEEFLELVDGRSDPEIIDIVKQWVAGDKITRKMKNRALWQILHAAKIYKTGEPNWNAGLRKY